LNSTKNAAAIRPSHRRAACTGALGFAGDKIADVTVVNTSAAVTVTDAGGNVDVRSRFGGVRVVNV
jgi:hypothetical protein